MITIDYLWTKYVSFNRDGLDLIRLRRCMLNDLRTCRFETVKKEIRRDMIALGRWRVKNNDN